MSEMKIGSFWKCLQQVLADARFPDTQQVNPWRIVRVEGVIEMPSRLPRPDDAPPAQVEHKQESDRPAPLFVRF